MPGISSNLTACFLLNFLCLPIAMLIIDYNQQSLFGSNVIMLINNSGASNFKKPQEHPLSAFYLLHWEKMKRTRKGLFYKWELIMVCFWVLKERIEISEQSVIELVVGECDELVYFGVGNKLKLLINDKNWILRLW